MLLLLTQQTHHPQLIYGLKNSAKFDAAPPTTLQLATAGPTQTWSSNLDSNGPLQVLLQIHDTSAFWSIIIPTYWYGPKIHPRYWFHMVSHYITSTLRLKTTCSKPLMAAFPHWQSPCHFIPPPPPGAAGFPRWRKGTQWNGTFTYNIIIII